MPQLAVAGPFDEGDLHHDLRTDPMRAQTGQAGGARERRLRSAPSHRGVGASRAGASYRSRCRSSRQRRNRAFVVADEQRAQADARALRIGEAAHHELLRRFAFHLQPVLRPAMLVRRAAALGDDTFPALMPRALPRRRDRQGARRAASVAEKAAPPGGRGVLRAEGVVTSRPLEPEDVEDVIAAPPVPRDLAVENHLVDRKVGDRARPPAGSCLEQAVA